MVGSKKHCLTDGLMDQLRARASNLRPTPPQNSFSSLSVFLWESPPLASIYKITFLVRLEADGQEALGFRFDDTLSESPRQIAWGGMVGTPQSPRCFLDGSQTFLTDSASKPSERCRRGWHVRIGKVNQIVTLFENTSDSLMIKLSLRKINSSTHITNLLSQPQHLVSLENPHQGDLRFSKKNSTKLRQLTPTPGTQKHSDHPSTSKSQARPNPDIPPTNSIHTISSSISTSNLLLQSSCNDYATAQDASRRFQSSSNPKVSSPPKKQTVPHLSHHPTSSTIFSALSIPLKSSYITQKAPRSLDPSPESKISAHLQNRNLSPSAPLDQTSSTVLPVPSNPSRTIVRAAKLSNRDDGRLLETLLLTSPSGSSKHKITDLTPGIPPPLEPNTPKVKIIPSSPTPPAATQVALTRSKSSLSEIPTAALETTPSSSDSHLSLVQNAHKTPTEMICFVFPPNANRLSERRLYVPSSDLIKVDYFNQALQSSNPTLSIDESRPKTFASFQMVRQGLLASLRFIPGIAFDLHRRFAQSHHEVPARDVQNHRLIFISLAAISRIGLGLVTIACSSCLGAMRLLFNEACQVMDALVPQPPVNSTGARTTTSMKFLLAIRTGLKEICQIVLTTQEYLIELGCLDEDNSDDELESPNEDGVQAPSFHPKVTFTINHIAYSTFCGISDYLQYGAIKFAPLHSRFVIQRALVPTLFQDESSTVPLAQDLSSKRRAYIQSNSQCIALHQLTYPQVRLTPCNPASIYSLANRLELEELKSLANQQITHELSPLNIFRQLKSASFCNHK